jgi:hypothetical protein
VIIPPLIWLHESIYSCFSRAKKTRLENSVVVDARNRPKAYTHIGYQQGCKKEEETTPTLVQKDYTTDNNSKINQQKLVLPNDKEQKQ